MDDEVLISFGRWIRRRRRALDLTQAALADLVGCSVALIVKIEGDARRPSREISALLAEHLQLAPAERERFVRCARAQIPVDMLPNPAVLDQAGCPLPDRAPTPLAQPAAPATWHTVAPRHNLPAQLDRLIGRADEIAALLELLRAGVRLVTLTGPGGIGKTRLALQVAAEVIDAFPDGAWFVDLAPISDPAQVPATIARALGLAAAPAQPQLGLLQAYLRARKTLVILDNLEQVAGAAPDIAVLLRAAPGLHILATSRAALHMTGEHTYPLAPLAVPPGEAHLPVAELIRYDAVRLFIERAQAVRPEFDVSAANARAVAEICARLEGMPLAIELAAPRVRIFSPAALLARLCADGGLELLTEGARDQPARQQTIRATIAWSEALLASPERELFYRLGVFADGWSLSGAVALGASEGDSGGEMIDRLESLVDHNLVALQESADSEPRYTMRELVRAYAIEQLRAAGQETVARRKHAAFLAEWAGQWDAGKGDVGVLAQIRREHANIHAALTWSFDAGGADAIYALRIFAAIWEYWFISLPQEGCAWAQRALSIAELHEDDPSMAGVLNGAARLLSYNTPTDARPLLLRSLELTRRAGDSALEAEVLRHLGEHALGSSGDLDLARRYIVQSLAVGAECHDEHTRIWSTVILAVIQLRAGELDAALASFAAALERCRAQRDSLGQITILRYMAEVAERQGDSGAAEWYLEQGIEQIKSADRQIGAVNVLDDIYLAYRRRAYDSCLAMLETAAAHARSYGQFYTLMTIAAFEATIHLVRGDRLHGRTALRQVLALEHEHPRNPNALMRTATIAARLAVQEQRYQAAAQLFGAISQLNPVIAAFDDQPDPALERWRAEDAHTCRGALGDPAFESAWATGQPQPLTNTIEQCLGPV